MKKATLVFIGSIILSACASNKSGTTTTTTTTSTSARHEQGTGMPSQLPHGNIRPSN